VDKRRKGFYRIFLLILFSVMIFPLNLLASEGGLQLEIPDLVLKDIPFTVNAEFLNEYGQRDYSFSGRVEFSGILLSDQVESSAVFLEMEEGRGSLGGALINSTGRRDVTARTGENQAVASVRAIPGFLSILPPLLAILLALLFRQVVIALVAGTWLGGIFLFDYNIIGGFYKVVDYFVINAITDSSKAQIIVFSLMFGGMVGVMTQSGGARGIADLITRFAKTRRRGQLSCVITAFLLFFDDYANVLVRGNLMRPITDRLHISREKLAFYVDVGAATVASTFVISTWIGYEVGLIDQGLQIISSEQSAYTVFLQTIPYRFYPFAALVLAFLIALTGRDFGPMWEAERRCVVEGKPLRDGAEPATDLAEGDIINEAVPARWINGALPVLSILAVGIYGLYMTGSQVLDAQGVANYSLGEIIGAADSYKSLLWASITGCLVALLLAISQGILSVNKAIEAWIKGIKSMALAMIILILAWSIGNVTQDLHTAEYLVQILKDVLSPYWLPGLTFIVAAAVAFATGTSWATMAILMPLVIPLIHTLGVDMQLPEVENNQLMLGVIGSVLSGAVFGDHCSPISDTTILSSMASACDHIDHVRTQLPYAVVAAVGGVLIGGIPSAFGYSPWISIALGVIVMLSVVMIFGKKVPHFSPASEEEKGIDNLG
jgi:Na+/H+ antiporter NhaC